MEEYKPGAEYQGTPPPGQSERTLTCEQYNLLLLEKKRENHHTCLWQRSQFAPHCLGSGGWRSWRGQVPIYSPYCRPVRSSNLQQVGKHYTKYLSFVSNHYSHDLVCPGVYSIVCTIHRTKSWSRKVWTLFTEVNTYRTALNQTKKTRPGESKRPSAVTARGPLSWIKAKYCTWVTFVCHL